MQIPMGKKPPLSIWRQPAQWWFIYTFDEHRIADYELFTSLPP